MDSNSDRKKLQQTDRCDFQCNMTQICNKWLQTRSKAKCWTLLSLCREKVMMIILLCVAKQLCIPLLWRRGVIACALNVHLGLQCLTIALGDPPWKQVTEFRSQC